MQNDHTAECLSPLALFLHDSPKDAASNIGLLAAFLVDARLDDADHPGLTLVHRIIRDSAAALSHRLTHTALGESL